MVKSSLLFNPKWLQPWVEGCLIHLHIVLLRCAPKLLNLFSGYLYFSASGWGRTESYKKSSNVFRAKLPEGKHFGCLFDQLFVKTISLLCCFVFIFLPTLCRYFYIFINSFISLKDFL